MPRTRSSRGAFPPLPLDSWRATRDTLHGYARLVGAVRRALAPPEPHWGHVTLRVGAAGLITPPVPAPGGAFILALDLVRHTLRLSGHNPWERPLDATPTGAVAGELLAALAARGIPCPALSGSWLGAGATGAWDREAVDRYHAAASRAHDAPARFAAALGGETTPVQLFPHHFDLAFTWFSGRQAPGARPSDAENAAEQMTFGFSTGDETVPAPYFYATAYPQPEGFLGRPLAAGGTWQQAGFSGALLRYELLAGAAAPGERLVAFLRSAPHAGVTAMAHAAAGR